MGECCLVIVLILIAMSSVVIMAFKHIPTFPFWHVSSEVLRVRSYLAPKRCRCNAASFSFGGSFQPNAA